MPCSFRDFVPPPGQHPRLGDINFNDFDPDSWAQWGMNQSFVKELWEGWQRLYQEPFRGVTTDGEVKLNLFHLRRDDAPIEAMQEAAQALISSSLSVRGYQKALDCMRINGFLGDIIGTSNLMNEGSYNFILFGEPSMTDSWGWSLWGYHLSLCCFALEDQIVISPPNQIDEGEHAGTEVFALEMQLAVQLMQSLSDENRQKAIVYDQLEHPDMPDGFPHPADGRTLAGAYEDNRVIPSSGVRVSEFSEASKDIMMQLIEAFIDFISNGSLDARMNDIKAHLDDTWLMWMGNYTD
ncbi:uncharacterized protein N7484_002825 [Penicillium longicatenatum]|uniref:uncharacterized protein n=1 Tax=Penicillium longicatenatum TaxID=1561947 RepID=UPI002547B12C|nr:uncharacterized protein N7484_002825 [Penicillium longicatenatum]KAJ5649102.1 hypothetical protein N7484_002825 [Penicillium longicatenatum]